MTGAKPLETLGEVDRDGEPVDVAGELEFLPAKVVDVVVILIQQPWRDRFDVDRAALEIESIQPDHRRTAVVPVLVVGDVQVNVVTGGVRQRCAARGPVVPIEGEKNLIVVLDQVFPQLLAVIGEHRAALGIIGVHQIVGGQDDRRCRMGGDHLARQTIPASEERQSNASSSHCRPPARNSRAVL